MLSCSVYILNCICPGSLARLGSVCGFSVLDRVCAASCSVRLPRLRVYRRSTMLDSPSPMSIRLGSRTSFFQIHRVRIRIQHYWRGGSAPVITRRVGLPPRASTLEKCGIVDVLVPCNFRAKSSLFPRRFTSGVNSKELPRYYTSAKLPPLSRATLKENPRPSPGEWSEPRLGAVVVDLCS